MTTAKKLSLFIAPLMLGFFIVLLLHSLAAAQDAQDAGVPAASTALALDAGTAVPAPAAPQVAPPLPDVLDAPGDAVSATRGAYERTGLWAAIAITLLMVLRTVGRRKQWPGRIGEAITGLTVVTGTIVDALMFGGTWIVVLAAALSSAALIVVPGGAEPKKQ